MILTFRSSTLSENQTDILDQVVDEDSLIGLSEEELIARQFRTRSIRKVFYLHVSGDLFRSVKVP